MQCRVHFKNTQGSDSIKEYVEEKISQRINRFIAKQSEVSVTFFEEGLERLVKCHVKGPNGFSFEVEAQAKDNKSAADLMLDKLETRLKKQKEKMKEHKKPQRAFGAKVNSSELEETPIDATELIKYEETRKRLFSNRSS